jgi:Tfp pilus assembly protein PilZ
MERWFLKPLTQFKSINMKSYLKSLIVLAATALLFISTNNVQAQIFQVELADSVNKYSAPQDFMVFGQLVKVRTKLIKHFGTTCMFEIEITNKSEKELSRRVGFASKYGKKNEVYEVNSAMVRLKPNYYAVYKLEMRECFKKGKKNPIESCMTCDPRLGFL